MADLNDLLSQAAGTPSTQPSMSLLDEKKAAVSMAADEKKASMGGTGLSDYDMATGRMYGRVPQNASEVERDMMTMDASNLYGKYGSAASELLAQRNAANRQVTNDATVGWNGNLSQFATDTNDLLTGFGQSLGGLAALGVGLVNDDAGTAMASGLADAAEWANSLQSDERQGRRNVAESLNRLDAQDIQAQMEKDIETDGELMASLKAIDRQSYSAVSNATEDDSNLIGGSIQALGSLLAAGPVAKGVKAAGSLAVANNTGRATVLAAEMGNPAARAAVAAAESAPILTAIGGLEAGGAYQQITADVMGRDFNTLYAESPQFRELVDGGMEPADAQIQVASDAGKMAAAITAPIAAATGILVRGFEANPFARRSVSQMISNLFREPTEEAIQGGTSQLAQNYAESQTANANQGLTENVGRQIGEGALYSVGSTAVTQIPNAAAQVASTASKTAMDALRANAEARNKANEATSPVSDETVAAAVQEVTANAAQDEQAMHQAVASMEGTDEQKDRASTYVNTVMDAIKFSEEDLLAASPNRLIRSVLNGSQNRLEAVQRLSDMVASTEPDSPEHLRAGFALYEMLGPLQNALETNAEQADAVLPDSPVGKALAGYEAVLSGIQNSPKVIKALQQMQAAVERRAAQPTTEITDATIETPIGQQAAQDTIDIAQVAPDKANLRATEQVLFQVSQGKLQVTPQQKAALDSTVALLRAAQAADMEAAQLGFSDKTSKVTSNIQSEDGEKGKSALQHSQGIMSAWKAGNFDLARDRLVHLGELVQHMKNKVSALNAHVLAGNPNAGGLQYQALTSDRKWMPSNLKMFVNFGSKKSIQQAQQIGSDATFLANVFNGLATAFPNLGVPHINATPLDSSLNAPADEVMSAYKASRANAPAVDATTTVPAETLTQTGYESLSDEDLNSQLNAAHDALIANPRDRQLREIFDALDEEMLRREEAAAAKIQQEELEEEQAQQERETTASNIVPTESSVRDEIQSMIGLPYVELLQGIEDLLSDPAKSDIVEESEALTDLIDSLSSNRNEFLKAYQASRNDIRRMASPELIKRLDDRFKELHAFPKEAMDSAHINDRIKFLRWVMRLQDEQNSRQGDLITGLETTPKEESQPSVQPVAEQPVPEGVVAPTSSNTGLSVLYPDLMGEDNNFIKAFDLPKEQLTRTIGTEEPLSFIQDALQNSLTLGNLLGHVLKKDFNKDVAAAYQSYLKLGDGILEKLNENLQSFLDGEYRGTTRRDLLINNKKFTTGQGNDLLGEDIAKFSTSKVLNLTEVTGTTLTYNDELVQMAVLAALQWMLTAEQRQTQLDVEDIAEFLKIDVEEVSDSWVELFNTGLDQTEAKRALAAKIKQYWGVVDKKTGRKGYTEGIPESMAAEIIRVLVDNGGLGHVREVINLPPTEEDGEPRNRTIARLIPPALEKPNKDSLGSPLLTYPTAIEDAVMVTPVERTYIGEDQIPDVAQKQLRNPDVDNTPQQKQVIENEQKTRYFVNAKMVSLYAALGRDNLIALFGSPEKGRVFNVNHAKSVEGLNRGIIAAYDQLMGTVSEAQGVARVAGQAIEEVPIRFKFNMTRVARALMLGRYVPQANKLVREAILSTRAMLNMNNPTHQNNFMLGVAQALGISVHKMLPKDAIAKAEALVTGEGALAEVRTLLGDFLVGYTTPTTADIAAIELSPQLVEKIKAAFAKAKEPVTPLALHALMELAWLDKQDARGRSQFQTSMYLEADGITNGPINAMVLLAKGAFTAEWLRNVAKGGLFFGRGQLSFNEHYVYTDDNDLYQTSTDKLKEFTAALSAELAGNPEGLEQMNNLLSLMDLFVPDLEYQGGVLTLKRGIAKNPLTITIYGSGQGGIANKLTSILTDAIYERMSLLAEARAVNPQVSIADAMFDGDTAKAAVFGNSLNKLIAYKTYRTKKEGLVVERNRSDRGNAPINAETFTFNQVELKNLRSNMRHLLVAPMSDAITKTVGESTLASATLIRQATQVQSIILESVFKKEIAAATERLKKTDKWRTTDFLSDAELNRIKKSMAHLSPFVKTPTQTFYIAGKQSVDLGELRYGEALDGSYKSPAAVSGPANSGVAGIPFLVIGPGDAQMMQNISVDPNGPTGTLKIFDGMNMPLDQIENGSAVANKAVWDSWMGNPLKAVHTSYSAFLKDAPLGNYDEATRTALTRALMPPEMWKQKVSDAALQEAMENVLTKLNYAQMSVEARHRAMARVQVSVDQMAAGATPHFREGNEADAIPAGYNEEQVATHLNLLYAEELAKLRAEPVATDRLTKEIIDLGTKHESGVYEFNSTDIRNIAKQFKLPEGQDGVLRDVVSSLATKGYTMVVGPAANIRKYIKDTGSVGTGDRQVDGEIKGFTNIGEKKIYSLNPSTETMVHELVHAATFETILAFFNGDALHPETKAAVKRIVVLMDQFLNMEGELVQPNAALQQSYADAVAAIKSWQNDRGLPTAERNAGALNEFMAWNLSNQELIRLGQRTQASKLARIVHSVLKAVRSLFWGKHRVPTPAKDMFTNLRFNSAIIMRSNPTTAQRFVSGVTFQNSQYGNNDRLSEINKAFNTSVARYLGTTVQPGEVAPSDAVDTGIVNALRVSDSFQANGFVMSQQEATTFRNIVTALSTEAALDSNALTLAQKLYAHVTKQLTVEHFMKDAESTNPADRYYAQRKFDSIMGTNLVELDLKGRSTLMPAFLALATVNDEFRAVLAQIDMPASLKLEERSLDAALTNTGRSMMDSLGNRMAGISSAEKSVKQAVDALQQHIAEQVQNREMFIDQLASKAGRGVDRANEIIVEKATLLADTIGAKGDALNQEGRNAVTRAIGASAQVLSILTSNERAEFAAQGITAAMNQVKGFAPIRALLNDFVGRTKSNAGIYDLIKGVRSMMQQARQQFREDLPEIIASKFSRELTKQEWASLFRGIGKTDLASLRSHFNNADIRSMLSDASNLQNRVSTLETYIQNVDPTHFALYQEKMAQLATYMNTGVPGRNLLRNAEAIARLLNENTQDNFFTKDADFVAAVDQLVTMYALQDLSQADKDVLAAMVRSEATGLDFAVDYLVGQRKEEQSKMSPAAALNHYKGFIPQESAPGVSMVVGSSRDHAKLLSRSYVRVGSYRGGAAERLRNQDVHYYFAPVAARAAFEQGIMQNVRQSVSGVDANTGYSLSPTAGRVTEPTKVKILARSMRTDRTQTEALMPIFDENGNVVAVERSLDPVVMERVAGEQHLANAIGVWRGRQHEEAIAGEYNRTLVDRLKEMFDADMAKSASNSSQYMDLFGSIEDPVIADAMSLMSPETRAYVQKVFGPEFMVRKDMLLDVLGERQATVGDAWTGNTRWSEATQTAVREMAQSVFGNKAYQYLVNSERAVQGLVSDLRTLIVVKSVVVPTANLMSNVLQLISHGVPLKSILRGMPRKVAEVDSYIRTRRRQIEVEAELRAAVGNVVAERRLKAEWQSIQDGHKRLSIWPLIQAGEFSSISDAQVSREDLNLTQGRLAEFIEGAVNKLPAPIATMGRYGLITKDTALFKALQKSVEYGDFLAKAVLFDDLTKRKQMSKKEALGRITEEFVNYDRLSGRFRATLENLGILWFYNFKLRTTKVALSTIRNNPLHALLAMAAPAPEMFGSVGLPILDNVFTKAADGSLFFSMGPGQGLNAPGLNLWVNLTQ